MGELWAALQDGSWFPGPVAKSIGLALGIAFGIWYWERRRRGRQSD